jgi:hypothetical protein
MSTTAHHESQHDSTPAGGHVCKEDGCYHRHLCRRHFMLPPGVQLGWQTFLNCGGGFDSHTSIHNVHSMQPK